MAAQTISFPTAEEFDAYRAHCREVADFEARLRQLEAMRNAPAEAPQPAPPSDEPLSQKQAARYCGVSTGTIRRWTNEGVKDKSGRVVDQLTCRRAGSRPRYSKITLDRWMGRRKRFNLE